ncbi:MAG: hypothetical protein LDL41_06430 [Coleofasciculus sp. S288]|nr:hypothetical protein [Coleofasciculus sp. S288]
MPREQDNGEAQLFADPPFNLRKKYDPLLKSDSRSSSASCSMRVYRGQSGRFYSSAIASVTDDKSSVTVHVH